MKTKILLLMYFFSTILYSQQQSPEIKPELPNVIPPSPTVAALMKFEEIPVSNYTGIPDISIPIHTLNLSKNLKLNVALKYHTNNIKVKDIASDVGLGWSLQTGGSITRTVRGIPDELLASKKIGIYHTYSGPYNNNIPNNYYLAIQNLQNYLANPISNNAELYREFAFHSDTKGLYDTEHDIWQFSFLNFSGRFIVKKTGDNYEVELLDDNTLVIIPEFDSRYSYLIKGFTIYDDLGNKYIFNISESAECNTFSDTVHQDNSPSNSLDSYTFKNAFHLTSIVDPNNQTICELEYNVSGFEEISYSSSLSAFSLNGLVDLEQDINQILYSSCTTVSPDYIRGLYMPKNQSTVNATKYTVKKISKIKSRNTVINFNYATGREDERYVGRENAKIVHEIEIKDTINVIDKFTFEYVYKLCPKKKMFLDKIKKGINTYLYPYRFEYKESNIQNVVAEDYWGYLKDQDPFFPSREVDRDNVSAFAIAKIHYPTGGYKEIEYEANTYSKSYDGDVESFEENTYNYNLSDQPIIVTSLNTTSVNSFVINNSRNDIYVVINNSSSLNSFNLEILRNGISYSNKFIENCMTDGCNFYLKNYPLGTYTIKITSIELGQIITPSNPINFSFKVKELKPISSQEQFLYGSGFRVKAIKDFDNVLLYSKKFSYDKVGESNGTSGVLVSLRPVFSYEKLKIRPEIRSGCQSGHVQVFAQQDIFYIVYNESDVISKSGTKGSMIGYTQVEVENTDHSKVRYYYTMESDPVLGNPPLLNLESPSFDYKRGLLLKEETRNSQQKLLKEVTNQYEFTESEVTTGIEFNGSFDGGYNSNPVYKLFRHYEAYKFYKDVGACSTPGVSPHDFCGVDFPSNTFRDLLYINNNLKKTIKGRADLVNKITKEYFYPQGSNVPKIVEITENFTYNPINKQIASHTVDNSKGEILTTNYFYHTGNSPYTQNRISEIEAIEKKKGSEVLSETRINYDKDWTNNQSYLPKNIETSKGSQSLETQVAFENYDEFGNPLQVRKENGMFISYIWGYNKTQSIAKIENIKYSQIDPNLILAVQNASNNSYDGTEPALISALNDLRAALPGTMVTTYTYKPLVGVRTITNPNGDIVTYDYDDFGRLIRVYDAQGNPVSENEYHYRTQN